MTCCPITSDVNAGICLACSYHCHEGHELVELYTKRYFRCDCGTPKFPTSNPCKLNAEKPSSNTDNKYNQNFKGKYCTCSRPYPDPEDTVEDNMIQCIICEDWYHGRHLKMDNLPADEDYAEMVCFQCTVKLPFLRNYLSDTTVRCEKETTEVDVCSVENKTDSNEDIANEENISLNSEVTCKIKEAKDCSPVSETLFLKENWRKDLCTCGSCDELYKNLKVSFLVDPEDTVIYYESQGRSKRALAPSGVQREIDALSSLDRITRTELVHEYNNLSTSLRDYLRKFAENGKVVRDEDIREFFSQLSANKKQKKDSFQYFCK
ncbi:putative E3 ubiquitin-protein ligase UBR7 [Armadillidium nasatum]|uniref:Putative E3 ubiquitin-protein ligase UBR7 n=1 Tax=Armadillidium nasatum TaxID=96803 RepID=A0A5N5T8J2_9CRUS|nr:putative E3 ubiquitin-protein ligase UBR7 [Armadillidium nasatum]